jgi:hypothetical protein
MIKEMNPLKIAVVILVILILTGIIGVYLISKNHFPNGNIVSTNNTAEKKSEKSFIVLNPLTEKYQTPEEPQNNQIEENIIPKIESKIQNLFGFNLNSDNQVLVGEYYKDFLEKTIKISFTQAELASMGKDDNKRVLLLEELLEQAVSDVALENLRSSFAGWHQLDERILAELNKISVKPEVSSIHQFMTDWFKYHSGISKKLSEENFSQDQLTQIVNEFKNKAKIHNSEFGRSLSQLENSPDFIVIPKAQAITCGATIPPPFYHFGGRVILMAPCDWGIVNTISLPCGGLVLFAYPVLAANPYLWKKPTIGAAVLGRSLLLPGCCCLGGCLAGCIPFEAEVLYFGTSLTP